MLTQAILFDLDGTLLDTAADLGTALNCLLHSLHLPTIPLKKTRNAAGQGSKGLLKLGLNIEEEHPDYLLLSEKLLNFYQEHLIDTTQLFPGMEKVLTHLHNFHIPWGIVTNKPERFTLPLIKALGLDKQASCVISGDTLIHRKPHPEPILHACQLLKHLPQECLYVGDAKIDMLASKAAGTTSIVAMYGYISENEKPSEWNADGFIQQPVDVLQYLVPELL